MWIWASLKTHPKTNKGTHLKQALIKVLFHAMENSVKLKEDTEFLQEIEKRNYTNTFSKPGYDPSREVSTQF